MKYVLGKIPPRWQLFCKYHPYADRTLLDDRALGTDEQLDFILSAMENGRALDPGAVERLSQNRSRKYRHHRKILEERFALPRFFVTDDESALATAATNEGIGFVKRHASDDEWNCLWALANGDTYRDIAASMKLSVGTLKARVSRCRERLFCLGLAA